MKTLLAKFLEKTRKPSIIIPKRYLRVDKDEYAPSGDLKLPAYLHSEVIDMLNISESKETEAFNYRDAINLHPGDRVAGEVTAWGGGCYAQLPLLAY